jgi:hypothetical protein
MNFSHVNHLTSRSSPNTCSMLQCEAASICSGRRGWQPGCDRHSCTHEVFVVRDLHVLLLSFLALLFAVGVRLTACLRNWFRRDLHGCQRTYYAGAGGFPIGDTPPVDYGETPPAENGSSREVYFVAWSEFLFPPAMPSQSARQTDRVIKTHHQSLPLLTSPTPPSRTSF